MAKSDALFELIHSLTKSEKRYFRLVSGLQGAQSNYMDLFDALDQMEYFDQQQLKKKFAKKAFTRQFHVAKNYLGKLILKSLRGFHLNHSADARLKSCLSDIEILYKRDLFTLCSKTIRKAENLARKTGHYRSLLEVLNWKRKVLLNSLGLESSREQLNRIIKQEQEVLQNLKYESEYWWLAINIDRVGHQEIESDRHHLINDPSFARTNRAKILHFHLRYMLETLSGNSGKAEVSIDRLLTYLEDNPYYLMEDPAPYITALNNKIGLYLNQRRFQDVPPLLDKIREIPHKLRWKTTNPLSMKLLLRTYNVELESYRDSGQFSTGVELIPEVRDFINRHQNLISNDYQILLHYQFAYLYFMVGDLKSALKDINVVLGYRYNSERADVVGYAQFLNLIIHYELGNSTVMKYAVDACRRYLKKRGNLMVFEKIILRLFSKLSTQPSGNHSKLFARTSSQLFGEASLIDNSQLDYLDFRYWIYKHIKKSRSTV